MELFNTSILRMMAEAGILLILFFLVFKKKISAYKKNEISRFNELFQCFSESEEIPVFFKESQLKYSFLNPAMEEVFGETAEYIIGKTDGEILDPQSASRQRLSDEKVLKSKSFVTDEMSRGGRVYKITKFPVNLANNESGVGGYVQTPTRKNSQNYLKALLALQDGVMIVDETGKVKRLNRTAEIMTGWPLDEARGMDYREIFVLMHEVVDDLVVDPIQTVFKFKEIRKRDANTILLSRNGRTYFLENTVVPLKKRDGELSGAVVIFRDITDRRRKHKKMAYMRYHDSLTGLYNRRFLKKEINQQDTKNNLPISVIFGDINGLKLINDVFGHQAGNAMLLKVTEVFRNTCREDDIIARWGGDEFAILLPQTENHEAVTLARRIRENLSREEVRGIKGSISMGITTKNKEDEDLLELLATAEEYMYIDKTLRRERGNEETFNSIVNNLYQEFPEEEQHARRTSQWCRKIAAQLGLPLAEIRKAEKAGYLHDIGKVALDREVIREGAFSGYDGMEEMQPHPLIGYRILNSFVPTADLAGTILSLHERFDGSGFPQGLKGEEIPLLARIIAVAAHFDELTQRGEEAADIKAPKALAEIKEKAQTSYDPVVVEALAALVAN